MSENKNMNLTFLEKINKNENTADQVEAWWLGEKGMIIISMVMKTAVVYIKTHSILLIRILVTHMSSLNFLFLNNSCYCDFYVWLRGWDKNLRSSVQIGKTETQTRDLEN